MTFVALKSSTLAAIQYDEGTSALSVRFKGGGEYEYSGVPENIYQGILKAASAGKYFDLHVKKGGYRFRQVN